MAAVDGSSEFAFHTQLRAHGADVEFTNDGVRATIRRSKTDQEGQGVTIAIGKGGACWPVKAIMEWLLAAKIESGPIFRPVRKGNRLETRD